MSTKAKAIQTLYRAGRISKEGVRQAVETGIITAEEYRTITGEYFIEPEVTPIIPETEPEVVPEVIPEEETLSSTEEAPSNIEEEIIE